jgi:Zn-dependent protease
MKVFTDKELRDLVISVVILALIFSFPDIPGLFLFSLILVFFSYFIHELGHKFVAKKFGCTATFKLWPPGILIGIMSTLFRAIGGWGIVFVAPGFVEIMPYSFGRMGFKVVRLGPRDLGLIALAGVGINVLFAVLFKMLPGDIFQTLSYYNGLLALFNLLPIPPLDGSKIFMWKMFYWLFLVFITVLVIFVF